MNILIPALLLGIYTMVFFFVLGLKRRAAVLAGEVEPKYYRAFAGGEETPRLHIMGRHLANLLEAPMLFYVGVLMLYVSGHTGALFVGLAWAFVGLRAVHAWIHLGSNYVLHRFVVFGLSMLVLLAMWTGLLVSLLLGPS